MAKSNSVIAKLEAMTGLNLRVRFTTENMSFVTRFITALVVPVLTYFGLEISDFTSWEALGDVLMQALSNPYVVFFSLANAFNVLADPTTKGFGDSIQAMTYKAPKSNK